MVGHPPTAGFPVWSPRLRVSSFFCDVTRRWQSQIPVAPAVLLHFQSGLTRGPAHAGPGPLLARRASTSASISKQRRPGLWSNFGASTNNSSTGLAALLDFLTLTTTSTLNCSTFSALTAITLQPPASRSQVPSPKLQAKQPRLTRLRQKLEAQHTVSSHPSSSSFPSQQHGTARQRQQPDQHQHKHQQQHQQQHNKALPQITTSTTIPLSRRTPDTSHSAPPTPILAPCLLLFPVRAVPYVLYVCSSITWAKHPHLTDGRIDANRCAWFLWADPPCCCPLCTLELEKAQAWLYTAIPPCCQHRDHPPLLPSHRVPLLPLVYTVSALPLAPPRHTTNNSNSQPGPQNIVTRLLFLFSSPSCPVAANPISSTGTPASALAATSTAATHTTRRVDVLPPPSCSNVKPSRPDIGRGHVQIVPPPS